VLRGALLRFEFEVDRDSEAVSSGQRGGGAERREQGQLAVRLEQQRRLAGGLAALGGAIHADEDPAEDRLRACVR
jgi:hypothetical protein